jgi:hypothetical protein
MSVKRIVGRGRYARQSAYGGLQGVCYENHEKVYYPVIDVGVRFVGNDVHRYRL